MDSYCFNIVGNCIQRCYGFTILWIVKKIVNVLASVKCGADVDERMTVWCGQLLLWRFWHSLYKLVSRLSFSFHLCQLSCLTALGWWNIFRIRRQVRDSEQMP